MKRYFGFYRYYRKVLSRAFKDIRHFVRQQLIVAVIATILILIVQIRVGIISKEMSSDAWLSVIAPYCCIFIGAFIIEAVRAPWKIHDEEKEASIESARQQAYVFNAEISTLTNKLQERAGTK